MLHHHPCKSMCFFRCGETDRTRTCGILVPNQALYQTELLSHKLSVTFTHPMVKPFSDGQSCTVWANALRINRVICAEFDESATAGLLLRKIANSFPILAKFWPISHGHLFTLPKTGCALLRGMSRACWLRTPDLHRVYRS